jgi:Cd2+/Zn2+-exporting ATPase
LVISTPVSIVAGLTALAKRGVLVKGGAHLESIAKLKALAVDKTGTITEGKTQGARRRNPWPNTEQHVLRIAAAIDAHSAHPLAKAVVAHADQNRAFISRAENYQNRSGRGAEGVVDGHPHFGQPPFRARTRRLFNEDVERRLAAIESRGHSVVVVGHRPHDGCKGEVLASSPSATPCAPNAKDAIRALHAAGVQSVMMLSGDNQRTVISSPAGRDRRGARRFVA